LRSANEIWEAALGELQIKISKPNYNTWLKETTGISYQNGTFVISAPNIFVAEWLNARLRSLVAKTLAGIIGGDVDIQFVVHGPEQNESGGLVCNWQTDGGISSKIKKTRLNPRYTFDNFIVGRSNRLIHAAAKGVAETPGHIYNPLFIYGGTGVGKTHLLHAIGHAAIANGFQVICISAEQFTNEFILAIRESKTEEFRNRFRDAQLLLLDDIHFIDGKEQTQECVFHTFNALYNASRQIVMTSDRPPQVILSLGDRLRSRFQSGLIVNIEPPDLETRLAILQAKAKQHKLKIPDEVLRLLARELKRNVRELEGGLTQLVAYAKLTGASLDHEMAAKVLAEVLVPDDYKKTTSPDFIMQTVANYFGIPTGEISGRKRDRRTTHARQIAIYLMREESQYTLSQIGKQLGSRDHSTVLHSYEKIAKQINTDAHLQEQVSKIQQQLHTAEPSHNKMKSGKRSQKL